MEKYITSFDNKKIYCYVWDDVKNPIGVVQIFHGLAEHAKRYEEFAKALNKAGFIVFADDHRGHGKTTQGEKIGTYKGKDIFYDTLKDEIFFTKLLKKEYKLPICIFGHSYGSFIAQEYITQCDLHDKAIICGSALMKNRFDIGFGLVLAWWLNAFASRREARLIEKLSYSNYNKKVKSGSWLNTDDEEVKKYYSDEFNGKPLSNRFYFNMFNAFRHIYKPSAIKKINKAKPIFLIAGSDDPVGSMTKSVKALFNFYKKNKIQNVQLKIYDNARHEILNEPKIKKIVYKDIINFLKN